MRDYIRVQKSKPQIQLFGFFQGAGFAPWGNGTDKLLNNKLFGIGIQILLVWHERCLIRIGISRYPSLGPWSEESSV
jgi:hypothetical protein